MKRTCSQAPSVQPPIYSAWPGLHLKRKHHYVHSNSAAKTKKQQPCCVSAEVPPAFFPLFSGSGRSESSVSSTLATVASLWAAPRPLIGSSGCALCCFCPVNRSSSASKRMENCYVVRRAAQASGTCDGRGYLGRRVCPLAFLLPSP